MLFKTLFTATVAAVASFVSADDSASFNPILSPAFGQVINVPKTFDITWTPTSSGNVNLILRKGGASSLTTVATIASGISNSGSYKWTPSSDLATDTGYAIEIVDANDSSKNNYSPYFTILAQGENWTSTSGALTSTSPATSSSHSASSASASASSASASSASSASASSASSASTHASSATTGSASTSGSASTKASTSASQTSSSVRSTTLNTSGAGTASDAPASASASGSSTSDANGINRLIAAALSVVASMMPFLI